MELVNSLERIKGLGPKTAEVFHSHGYRTIEDLLYFFPRAWIDATTIVPIASLKHEQSSLIEAYVSLVREGMSQRTRIPYLRATVTDASGSVDVMWFHARYLKQKVKPGERLLLYGRYHKWGNQPAMIMAPKFITKPAILAVYPEIGGLASHKTRNLIEQILPLVATLPDYLPEVIRRHHAITKLGDALRMIHAPASLADIEQAKKRFAFDELLMLLVPSIRNKAAFAQAKTAPLLEGKKAIEDWTDSLPFGLTRDQRATIQTIGRDLEQEKPMNRLVQGDVGSGKTVVGFAAVLQTILSGKQAVWLAPTELLAEQHWHTAQKLLAHALPNKQVALWTRSQHRLVHGSTEVPLTQQQVGDVAFVIGTHALFSEKIHFSNLGLLVIDEQHRFGVKQRSQLRHFGGSPIHLLSMTATPIPRTMGLLLYGDLDLSLIREKPAGREAITTRVVGEENREKAFQFIDGHIGLGRQVYVVCPVIEPSHDTEANIFTSLFQEVEEKKAVVPWAEELQKRFPHRRVAMLHGKLPAKEKVAIMDRFRRQEIDIVVATSVIEVGVDVPNATFMLIEAAERFGLAQLHQLRGRVGRGKQKSYCFLFPSKPTHLDNTRLQTLEATNDGLTLAEKDLELRGPGELTGLVQSGLPALRFASLQDVELMQQVKALVPECLEHPEFVAAFERFWRLYHPE